MSSTEATDDPFVDWSDIPLVRIPPSMTTELFQIVLT